MKFIDYDDVKRRGLESFEVDLREGLNGGKHVSPLVRSMPVDIELAEAAITQHLPERAEALLQDLLSMCDEQQSRIAHRCPQAFEVKRGDDGLARAGCGGREVFESEMSPD